LTQAHISRLWLNKKRKRNYLDVGTGKHERSAPRIVVGKGELIFQEPSILADRTEATKLQTVVNNGMEILITTIKPESIFSIY